MLSGEFARNVAIVTVDAGLRFGSIVRPEVGAAGNTLHLTAGSSISGPVLHNAKPVEGLRLVLVTSPTEHNKLTMNTVVALDGPPVPRGRDH